MDTYLQASVGRKTYRARLGAFYCDEYWCVLEGKFATIGVTDAFQKSAGAIVRLHFPSVGERIRQFGILGKIESIYAVLPLLAPVSGKLIESNGALSSSPELVNESPYDRGWLARLEVENIEGELEKLDSAQDYFDALKKRLERARDANEKWHNAARATE